MTGFYYQLYGGKDISSDNWERNLKEIKNEEKSMQNNEGRSDSESSDEDIPKTKKKQFNKHMLSMMENDMTRPGKA